MGSLDVYNLGQFLTHKTLWKDIELLEKIWNRDHGNDLKTKELVLEWDILKIPSVGFIQKRVKKGDYMRIKKCSEEGEISDSGGF